MRLKNSLGIAVALNLFVFAPCSRLRAEEPPLIDIRDLAPGIRIEMRYASTENFTGRKLYPVSECLLCEPAAQRLARVQKNLEKKGLGLKVWDCYRPLSVQKQLWTIVPDDRYVADPKTGSRHNRGASVDLTLVDSQGRELRMPTLFDDFSEKAHRSYKNLPQEAIKNRDLLQAAMEKEGFIGLPTEWWHFDSPEWSAYALRDEPLGSRSLRQDIPSSGDIVVPGNSKQLLLVVSATWTATVATLQAFEKAGPKWKKVDSWDVNLGAKGMALGCQWRNLSEGPQKTEGDLTAPAGLFKIGTAYGYSETPPVGTKWKYQQVTDGWLCIDDPKSAYYNRVFQPDNNLKRDWKSAETMRRKDDIYKWVINIEQNPAATKGCGSCVFLHVWRKLGSSTEGCTAMEEQKMEWLLKWLDPMKSPVLVQLPDELYRPLKKSGHLP